MRPTYLQLEALVQFLEQNPGIAKGFLRTQQAKSETKRKWEEAAINLNAIGGAIKDGKGWSKFWADKKCSLKKLCSRRSVAVNATGGGNHNVPELTAIEERMVSLVGGRNFAEGDTDLFVNPFPTMPVSSLTSDADLPPAQDDQPSTQSESTNMFSSFQEEHTTPLPTLSLPAVSTPRRSPRTQRRQSPLLQAGRSPRNQVRRSRFARTQVLEERERLILIEEKRVEAERLTAIAFKEATEKLGQCAEYFSETSAAIRSGSAEVAAALRDIAKAISLKK